MARKPAAIPLPVLLERLHAAHPDATYELNWETPLQLLVATILAAQCPDTRVNEVTKSLFQEYATAQAFADADRAELEADVKPTGFYRNKAKAIQETCQILVTRFGGEVPKTMPEMLTLSGVARKTANVVLNCAFGIPSGIIVDSHVGRLAQRFGLTAQTKGEKIEEDLMKVVPEDEWCFFGPAVVLHGRYVCTAKNPKCDTCVLDDVCPKVGVQ